jgi:hypothetical protein
MKKLLVDSAVQRSFTAQDLSLLSPEERSVEMGAVRTLNIE